MQRPSDSNSSVLAWFIPALVIVAMVFFLKWVGL